ncbi:MAG: hypothetical protein DI535_00075 [Citrobacter freundii]|nr:MAG: hypothetical protein DI535_00075 [Citrobacter freundii]
MHVKLYISPSRYIYELQHEFNHAFPFLRLEFFRIHRIEAAADAMQVVTKTSLLRAAGVKSCGYILITEQTTVAELAAELREKYGLIAQVVRQSGNVWLETTMTEDWTLIRQNEHGRELSNQLSLHQSPEGDITQCRNLPDQ